MPGNIVICALNGELTVKRLQQHKGQWLLGTENPAYPDIVIREDIDRVIRGMVTNVILPL